MPSQQALPPQRNAAPAPASATPHPRTWSAARRWYVALVVWNLVAPIDMCSTLYAGGQAQIQAEFHVSRPVATLGVGLVNLGFAIGPLLAAPLSELYGRQPIYIASTTGFALFALGTALAQSIATLLVFRLLAGLLGAAVFSNFGGTLADLFAPEDRAPLVALFALVLQGAPTIGPVPGSYIGQFLSWRWIMALPAIWAAIVGIFVLFLPETEPTKIARDHAAARPAPALLWGKALLTPLMMLCFEPIVLTTSLYHAFIYGLLFILLEAAPDVYRTTYGLSLGQTGLTFLSIWVGNALGVALYFTYFKRTYAAQQRALPTTIATLPPEARLPGALFGALLVPMGMLALALTATPRTPLPPLPLALPLLLGGLPTGAGLTLLQLSLTNFYIDAYPTRAASALAANVFVRNACAAGAPALAAPLYVGLGARKAGLLLAGVAGVGVPAGAALLVYGRRLRAASRWAIREGREANVRDGGGKEGKEVNGAGSHMHR